MAGIVIQMIDEQKMVSQLKIVSDSVGVLVCLSKMWFQIVRSRRPKGNVTTDTRHWAILENINAVAANPKEGFRQRRNKRECPTSTIMSEIRSQRDDVSNCLVCWSRFGASCVDGVDHEMPPGLSANLSGCKKASVQLSDVHDDDYNALAFVRVSCRRRDRRMECRTIQANALDVRTTVQ
jgi:hypothetical protein